MTKLLRTISLLSLLVATQAAATELPDQGSPAASEWGAYVAPLLPIGERMAALMPDQSDAQMRQELYRFLYSLISSGYIGRLYADREHPDFWPFLNEAFNAFAPNPDTSYYMTPIEGNGVYRISGFRGSVRIANFQISGGTLYPYGVGAPGDTPTQISDLPNRMSRPPLASTMNAIEPLKR